MDTAPNLTPVLGRYYQREWSHGVGHRLYDTAGKAYLDFANGIAVTAIPFAKSRYALPLVSYSRWPTPWLHSRWK